MTNSFNKLLITLTIFDSTFIVFMLFDYTVVRGEASWKKETNNLKYLLSPFLLQFGNGLSTTRAHYMPLSSQRWLQLFSCVWIDIDILRYDQVSSHMGPPTYRGRKVIKTWLTWLINIQITYILFLMMITMIITMIMMMINISSIIIMNIHIYRSYSLSTTLLCPAPSTPLWELLMRGPHAIFITYTSM